MSFRQKAQSRLYGSFFGTGATAPHCAPHQSIVNVDIRTHSAPANDV
jgi:hypothetical protein